MESWQAVPDFPQYLVSDQGRVVNTKTEQQVAISKNQQGISMVFLRDADRQQFTRSVAVLVAHAFVPHPGNQNFDSIIHLDGDRSNTRAKNLAWRPRWFAVKYHQQFLYYRFHGKLNVNGLEVAIEDIDTEEVFDTSALAAIQHGLMEIDVVLSVFNGTPTWPGGHRFRIAAE